MTVLSKVNTLVDNLLQGVMQELKTLDNYSFIDDKISTIVRTRVTAEFCSSLVKLHKARFADYKGVIGKLSRWIISNQNMDGSWNEKHLNYDKPSSVFTSICALSLLDVKEVFPELEISDKIFEDAAKFLVDQEIDFGYFRKSEYYHADILNADAMVGAFLVRVGSKYNNLEHLKTGKRALANVCAQQFMTGAYPYGGPHRAYPYKYHLNVQCIHYQTVTLYYLMKSLPIVKSDWLEHSINSGIEWLLKNQNYDGSFNWKKSGLNFALYLTATYALTIPIYLQYAKINEKAGSMISKSLDILEKQMANNILLRWEKGDMKSVIFGIFNSLEGGFIGEYPLSYKIMRTLHRVQREIARTRVSQSIIVSHLASRASGYSAFLSTVESSTNYPDLYMTTEALDALSSVLVKEIN